MRGTARQKSFYRSANASFGKVGLVANKEVTVQFQSVNVFQYCNVRSRRLLLNQVTTCVVHAINRFFMELFRTSTVEIVIPSAVWVKRIDKF